MAKIVLPMTVIRTPNVESLRDLRNREAARQQAGEGLLRSESFKDRVDSWLERVASYDNVAGFDQAAHKRGLIVLDNVDTPPGRPRLNEYRKLSAEQTLSRNGKVLSSEIEIRYGESLTEENIALISYKNSSGREVYTETVEGKTTRLVLDHSKGILTYTDPYLEPFS
jgi:hypothetical protein